jgi:hypothetical protein
MTIKFRFHPDKAIIRWKTPGDREFLKQQMTLFRDSQMTKISVKDEKGREMPRMLVRKPAPPQGPPILINKEEIQIIPQIQPVEQKGEAVSATQKT